MKLENPPVTQTWIGFSFNPGQQGRHWGLETAGKFLAQFEDSLPHREAVFAAHFEVQELSPGSRPRIVRQGEELQSVRARDAEGTHWLQVGADRLVCIRARGAHDYPGFEPLRDEALDKLSEYLEFFRPSGLRSVELHYVDQIEIPIPPEGRIDLADYFNLRVEVPDEFGPVDDFSTRLFLSPPNGDDTLEVRFQSEPPNRETEVYRFRIDWHMVCPNLAATDRETVGSRLEKAHEDLGGFFKASFTERTWALFRPSEREQ